MATADNVYAEHDEDGRILQSNQVFNNDKYADCLREHERKFIQHRGKYQNLHSHFVWNGNLSERPTLRLKLSAKKVKPGSGFKIAGIPAGANVNVKTSDGYELFNGVAPAKNLDFPTPVPAVYEVNIDKWPYRGWSASVEVSND